MKNLPASDRPVALGPEMLGERDGIGQPRTAPPVLSVVVDSRGGRSHPGHDRHPGRVAGGSRAVGVGEQGATSRQAVEVRGMDSFSSSHAIDPVIQVVHRNEQHVGGLLLCVEAKKCASKQGGN